MTWSGAETWGATDFAGAVEAFAETYPVGALLVVVLVVVAGLSPFWWLAARQQARCRHDFRRRCVKCDHPEPEGGQGKSV